MEIIKREMFGAELRQRADNDFLCVTDLVKVCNSRRLARGGGYATVHQWIASKQTSEYRALLRPIYGETYTAELGRGKTSWAHPLLFIRLVMMFEPRFRVEEYPWLLECLVKYRLAGSVEERGFIGALYANSTSQSAFIREYTYFDALILNVVGALNWHEATPSQTEYRFVIYDYITQYCGVFYKNNMEAVRLGLLKAKEWKLSLTD
jgi:hypothetical protein